MEERVVANRHANKRLRAAVRARMASSGESYQRAHARLLRERGALVPGVDLLACKWFGIPITVATIEIGLGMSVVGIAAAGPASWRLSFRWLASRGLN